MTYLTLPDTTEHRLSFYLAMEEHAARTLRLADDAFFMWQVAPTVILGRNQVIENEVNLDYCRRAGIGVYRRKSGGGCVYADRSNVMFSYVTRSDQVTCTFNRYIQMVVDMLHGMGIDASSSGRNDILIGGRKVSGNAFYHTAGYSIVHGTMLYDTDMQNMVAAITPSVDKLVAKGVQSVRQRIALLKDYTDITLDAFMRHVRHSLCESEHLLTDDDVAAIARLEKGYLTDDFIYGHSPAYSVTRRRHIDGVGEVEVRMTVKGGRIESLNILGDFFLVGDMDRHVIQPLLGAPLRQDTLAALLPEGMDDIIRGLRTGDLIDLLTDH